jgi:hypothetical protein
MTTRAIHPFIGDYDLRTRDIDTEMVREVTSTLIDAARLARIEFDNGFPNWELFRSAYAGDNVHLPKLKRWAHEFGIAAAVSNAKRPDKVSMTAAGAAGLDALHMLLYLQPLLPHTFMADGLGIKSGKYKRLRDGLRDRLSASLGVYVLHLGAAYRRVLMLEREVPNSVRLSPVQANSRWDGGLTGTGNYRRAAEAGDFRD